MINLFVTVRKNIRGGSLENKSDKCEGYAIERFERFSLLKPKITIDCNRGKIYI